jgi:ferritin
MVSFDLNDKKSSKLISDECIEMLNFRISEEEKSARLYESMSIWLDDNGYIYATQLWDKYSKEEYSHAQWAKDYLLGLAIKPELRDIESCSCDYDSLAQIIKKSHEHETEITIQCKELAKCAMECGDFMLFDLASKYLREQHEELTKLQFWLDQVKTFGDDPISLRLLDHEMKDYI